MNSNEIQELANEINQKLLGTNKKFFNVVVYQHQDGTSMVLQNSFLARKENWYIIFCEHHLPIVVYQDDVEFIGEYKYSSKPIRRITGKWIKSVRKKWQIYQDGRMKNGSDRIG